MNANVTIDNAGRVVIPKPLRDELRLAPGDTLSLESDGERMTLRPVRPQSAMRKERGIWVFHGGASLTAAETDRALADARHERDQLLAGEGR
jgi:AbrB family looped-hinge helix DNA binding protein